MSGRVGPRALLTAGAVVSIAVVGSSTLAAQEVVLAGAAAGTRSGRWTVAPDSGATQGTVIRHPDAGAAKITTALASPTDYFELTFDAQAGQPYRLWIRGRAESDHWGNDSVFVQFSDSVTATGSPVYRIGSTSAADVNLESCSGCGLSGWMWQDNGYGSGVLGPPIYFAASGTKRLRVQTREDGLSIDQILLSPSAYLNSAPTSSPGTSPATPATIVLAGAAAETRVGRWAISSDATAVGGAAIRHPNAGAPKIVTALATPGDYFEIRFDVVAGIPYHLWIHGRADDDFWGNDSVFVQFSASVTQAGSPIYRIGTTSAADVNLEDCSGCGVSGWMWQDNGYGRNVLGPSIYFAATGQQTMRVQTREDGLSIDQIVLSPSEYLAAPPVGPVGPSPTPPPPPPPTPPTSGGPERYVSATDDLQAVLDAAQAGDVILLEAGATFRGNYVLRNKPGSSYITVRSATADHLLPGPGVRITPAASPRLARIESGNNAPAIIVSPGAHHWRVMLLELGPTRLGYGDILRIGEGGSGQTSLSQVPYDLDLDRLYIHGHPLYGQKRGIALNGRHVTIRNSWIADIKAVGVDSQAIGGWNGPGPVLIENNYLEAAGENVLFGGGDPAIAGLVAEDIVVRRNYMSRPLAWRNPIVATPTQLAATRTSGTLSAGTYTYRVVARRAVGGGFVGRSNATPEAAIVLTSAGGVRVTWASVPDAEDYVVYGRGRFWTVTAPDFTDTGQGGTSTSGAIAPGDVWQVKNIFELKNARRVLVEYNVFENNWQAAQPGYAILFTVRNQDGGCSWCVVSDVRFQYNVVRNVTAGINILGYDTPYASGQTHDISVRHNLFHGLTTALGGNGWFLLIGEQPRNIVVDHNTVDHGGTTVAYAYGGSAANPLEVWGFQFTNNAMRHGEYGLNGAYCSTGTTTLSAYFPDGVVRGNWLAGGSASQYPSGNFFSGTFASAFTNVSGADYRPAPGGPLVGAAIDGTDIGADMSTLLRGIAGVVEGIPPF